MTPAQAAQSNERRLALAHELAARALVEEPEKLWPAIAEALARYFGCERVTVFQRDGQGRLVSRFAQGLDKPVVLEEGKGLAGAAAAEGKPCLTNDAGRDPRFHRLTDRDTGFETRQALAFPLRHRGRAVGVVELLNKAGGFTAADVADADWLDEALSVIFAKFTVEEEKAELSRRMLQVEKMASLGRMASGIAHEVNNPLTAILGLAQVLMRRPETSPDSMPNLLKIDAEVRRIQKLVGDLLGFSRGAPPVLGPVDVAQVCAETLDLAAPELKKRRVKAAIQGDPGIPKALGDAHALKQVLLNLTINAAHAAEGGHVWLKLAHKNGRLQVEVCDDGPGVPAELMDRIFEPFFTTKPDGQGTGLGLYVSAEIVRRHGSKLACGCRMGGGASFSFDLQVASA